MKSQRVEKSGLVSIIIPVYNCEKYLDKCLGSVIAQSYRKLEIIVINDGSKDNSGQIIQEYADNYANILPINQTNSGVSAARNNGIEKASGEYLLFVDGDDYLEAEYVKKLVEAAQKNASDLVICGCTMVDQEGKVIRELIPEKYKKRRAGRVGIQIIVSMLAFI
jgi:Glycosyltransferases involved in cell wall biogenesis